MRLSPLIAKTGQPVGRENDFVPSTVVRGYDFIEPGSYLGIVGSIVEPQRFRRGNTDAWCGGHEHWNLRGLQAMKKAQFDNVDLMLVDPAQGARESTRNILRSQGFRNLGTGARLKEIHQRFDTATPDLLISEIDLEDGDFCAFVADVRQNNVGDNPFLPVVGLTFNPTPELVKVAVNSGIDHLLVKPFSAGQLMDRINALIEARNPFIVTYDYIGPERRKGDKRSSEIPQMDVPNILRAKAFGQMGGLDAAKAIKTAQTKINTRKLERNAFQIGYLVGHITVRLEKRIGDDTTSDFLSQLLNVIKETEQRLVGTKHADLSKQCGSLANLTESIRASKEKPGFDEIVQLKILSRDIQQNFDEA
jgi:DNA-binding response OmpR family regulator